MPIVRTYQCEQCFHRMEVMLTMEQCDDPAPPCPVCEAQETAQVFKPVAIGGSNRARAVKLAEKIAEEDYGVADFSAEGKQGGTAKVRYKDQKIANPSTWGNFQGQTLTQADMQAAFAAGRETRLKFGDGLDVLKANLKSGAQPDLIEMSKRRAMRVT